MVRFLVVDDDPASRRIIKLFLSPYGECDTAECGSAAIELFLEAHNRRKPYHLICLDLLMPGANGHETLQQIRALEAARSIYGSDGVKVIVITAVSDTSDCITAFSEGCEGYLTKPFRRQRLLAEVQSLLGELKLREAVGSGP